MVTSAPAVMDTTQGGTAPLVLQRGRAPLVTVWPAASTNGTVDAKGKFAVPKGTVETLKKYLELQPNGAHASDVKEMLNALK